VFFWVTLLIFLVLGIISLRDYVKYPSKRKKLLQKILLNASQKIAFGEYEEAEKLLLPLFNKKEGRKDVSLLFVQVLRGLKREKEALTLACDASRDYPEELLFRLEEAKILLESGRVQEALEAFQVCEPILYTESDLLEYATALFLSGSTEVAFLLIESLIPHSKNGRLHALAADCFFEKKKYSEAVQLYKHALIMGFHHHHLLNQLGNSYRKLGNLAEAEKIFRKVLEKDDGDISATLGLGQCIQERGLYAKALLIYQSGLAWERRDPRIFYQAGICSLVTKKFHLAENYFSELLKLEGPNEKLLSYLGYAYEGQQKWQEAEQTYLHLVQEFPAYSHGYRALAWLFGVGLCTVISIDQGVNFAYISLKQNPDPIAWEILSACEARIGNYERAHQIQEFLIAQDQDSESRQRRIKSMRLLRKHQPLEDVLVSRVVA
jgi:tetratricopeptide (TPR) repeat protein